MGIRTIETEQDLLLLMEEVRNRQFEDNPVTMDISNIFFGPDEIDWNTQYLKITKIDNHEVIDIIKK